MDRPTLRSLIIALGDLAISPLYPVGADNDFTTAHTKLAKNIAGVRQFLVRHGIDTTQLQLTGISVPDSSTNQYVSPERQGSRHSYSLV